MNDDAHNDLVPHLLLQLRTTKIPIFQQAILKWHRKYMENTLKLAPQTLVTMADTECQVLKHSNQWVKTIDPSIAAMQAMVRSHQSGAIDVFKSIAAHFSELSNKQTKFLKEAGRQPNKERNVDGTTLEWVYSPPRDLSESRYFNSRHWYYCTKCGRNGRWVCTHSDEMHVPSRN